MSKREKDWITQAERDLKHSENSILFKDYEWACFSAQQAAEKSLKAVYQKINEISIGHSILGLLKGLEEKFKIPEEFYSYSRMLSRYYIEARYPNGFPEGIPADYFDEKMAREAKNAASEIFQWCKDIIYR